MTCDCRSHNGFMTAKGLEEAAQRSFAGFDSREVGLTGESDPVRLDRSGSVSGLRRDETPMIWNEEILDEQFRRNFLQLEAVL